MTAYVWRDQARRAAPARTVVHPRPLTRREFAALTPAQKGMRAELWARTVELLRADHERRYTVETRQADLLAELADR